MTSSTLDAYQHILTAPPDSTSGVDFLTKAIEAIGALTGKIAAQGKE